MRLQHHINENEGIPFDILEKKCKPYLNDISKNLEMMYSGRRISKDWFIKKVRGDREPRDMDWEIHRLLDDMFYKKFGWKARSNVVFVTGDVYETKHYGNPYMIFPVGKYKFIYSDDIPDLYRRINSKGSWSESELSKLVDTYQTGDINKAIDSESEIMLNCKEYIAIHNAHQLEVEDWLDER
jgi:hypothetical protein